MSKIGAKSKGRNIAGFLWDFLQDSVIMGFIFISFLGEFLHRESLQLGQVSRLLSCKSGII